MSHYCLSDIHGQYDLLTEGLQKIKFNSKKDKLFILGDICNLGPNSLKIYDFILNNKNSVTLLKGNHDIYLIEILKVYQQVLQYNDLYNILKIYVINYVSGFEKNREKACKEKVCKYATTERRKRCVETFKQYTTLAKKYKIEKAHLLVNFYESFFKIRKLMFELINNPAYDYEALINFINQCKSIKTITIKNEKWVMYHSRYSEHNMNHTTLKNQLVDRLKRSYFSKNINYVYGHFPIPKVYSNFTTKTLNYNKILKAIDYNNNKYYNIDVSHFGICFLKLETLEETYIGKTNNKQYVQINYNFDNYNIEDITETIFPYQILYYQIS